jgi:hypothetical protein
MFSYATAMPLMDAHDDFLRARRAHLVRRAGSWPRRGRRGANNPRVLCEAAGLSRRPGCLEVISLTQVVGTLEPSVHFDARFRPASEWAAAG